MKERCKAKVAFEFTASSQDSSLKLACVDTRWCRMKIGHGGEHRFNMTLNANGRVADAEVRWRVRKS